MCATFDSMRRLFHAARAPGCCLRWALFGFDFFSDNGDLLNLLVTVSYSVLGNTPAAFRTFAADILANPETSESRLAAHARASKSCRETSSSDAEGVCPCIGYDASHSKAHVACCVCRAPLCLPHCLKFFTEDNYQNFPVR